MFFLVGAVMAGSRLTQDVGELGLCRIVLDLGVAGDGVTTDDPADGGEEVDMRSQVQARNELNILILQT